MRSLRRARRSQPEGPWPRARVPDTSMEVTQQIRDFAKEKGLDSEVAVTAGLLEKSGEPLDAGGEIYSEA